MRSEEKSICPVCGGHLNVIGSRKRMLIDEDGSKTSLRIRRLLCVECRRIHHELPDIIMPYKRHCAKTIERIIGREEGVCCEESTIRRIMAWWISLKLYLSSIIASLNRKYGVVFSEKALPREIVRAVVNTNLWPHTRSAFVSGG